MYKKVGIKEQVMKKIGGQRVNNLEFSKMGEVQ